MSAVYDSLKTLALRYLPDALLQSLKARHYARALRSFREDDEPDLRVVRLLVPSGTTTVDLGANVGVYTKVLSELAGPRGRVISVEPVPQTFELLASNVGALALNNVDAINVAVSDAAGLVTMEIPSYSTGGADFYQSRIVSAPRDATQPTPARRVTVDARTLDSIVAGVKAISFVKCDVEGHERACLAGASAMLRDQRPAWLIEISSNPDVPGENGAAVFDLLASYDYTPWLFDGTRLRRRARGDTSVNYFFLTDEHLARVRSIDAGILGV